MFQNYTLNFNIISEIYPSIHKFREQTAHKQQWFSAGWIYSYAPNHLPAEIYVGWAPMQYRTQKGWWLRSQGYLCYPISLPLRSNSSVPQPKKQVQESLNSLNSAAQLKTANNIVSFLVSARSYIVIWRPSTSTVSVQKSPLSFSFSPNRSSSCIPQRLHRELRVKWIIQLRQISARAVRKSLSPNRVKTAPSSSFSRRLCAQHRLWQMAIRLLSASASAMQG